MAQKTFVSLLNGSKRYGVQFKPELLQRMDFLYAFYHQQWWCYRKMLNHFKFVNALFNELALHLMAADMIAGPILDNSTLVACLAAVGTVVKGWNDFKNYSFKVAMSRFAFTTYAKALTELKTHVRGVPLEGLEGFLIKMETLDDTIIDFTPPVTQAMCARLPSSLCVPTRGSPMLRGWLSSSFEVQRLLDRQG